MSFRGALFVGEGWREGGGGEGSKGKREKGRRGEDAKEGGDVTGSEGGGITGKATGSFAVGAAVERVALFAHWHLM